MTRRAAGQGYETLRTEQDGRVLTVLATDPPYTYMTAAMQADVVRLVDAVADDDSVGVVVVTGGVPGRYITHFDIGDLLHTAEHTPRLPPAAAWGLARGTALLARAHGPVRHLLRSTPLAGLQALADFQRAAEGILRSPAVWIAAVDGPCGGGGLELSVFFDLRFASPGARFLLPELALGLSTTFGGQRLARLVGPSRALEIMLEARAYTAEEAARFGLVDDVVPAADLLPHTRSRAARFARRPRAVVAAQKRILHDPDRDTATTSLVRETAAQVRGFPAATVALRRWLERQDPSGESTFLTDPGPWQEGTAADLVGGAR
ncbi:Enoyl-CoA hydratase [Pseudonocardia sp. Ae168_Ps1]|uniref:enoyl-CoA hydratase-related protein n=1 Tax=unclassified Pseudonocardia TaxID=2619320 RepID=UPI00094ADFD8|nr:MULTISPECIES: enoyl-CoA hydratase-related protein [unclassified Pseudonocardia]OLL76841.1 Enoyl-CoA hydratase [Pseudonocardia sp. Ae150A_Ps1]OLL82855.1 Enoyl-CoA hydratase [Pseudonocardia sp. Ae168_Ps1]OLL83033.1 Enoyl-CoA hydratase [Pseudonocardia sp. Ae263_Ps1]OLL90928.1 Enoyl-CoA hydratase [Pseudonocardia sp. Ae356_Ps1]